MATAYASRWVTASWYLLIDIEAVVSTLFVSGLACCRRFFSYPNFHTYRLDITVFWSLALVMPSRFA
jgi:hypothetical protein